MNETKKTCVLLNPTMEEIEKYGQPVSSKFRESERKIGTLLTLMVGAAYTYILLRYTRSTGASPLALTATVVFVSAGVLSLAQGVFHPFGQISGAVWHRGILTTAGVAIIGTGTYVGITGTEREESGYIEQILQERSVNRNDLKSAQLFVLNDTSGPLVFEFDDKHSESLAVGWNTVSMGVGKHKVRVSGRCGALNATRVDTIVIELGGKDAVGYRCVR
jgi:hypothetical protein